MSLNACEKLNGLDLFSGIGGNALALREWVRTIAYCECELYPQSVLLSRMQSGDLEPAPIWDDVKTLGKEHFALPVDIIVGGFPCQSISTAGKGEGLKKGNRSGLFFEIVRLTKELKPAFVFLENVPAIRTRGLDTVLQEFTQTGYDCRWTMLSASEIGAPHKRERWFLLANTNTNSSKLWVEPWRRGRQKRPSKIEPTNSSKKRLVANTHGYRLQSGVGTWRPSAKKSQTTNFSWWKTEPSVCRVVDELQFRVDRLKCLGNSVVPEQAKEAFKMLMGEV